MIKSGLLLTLYLIASTAASLWTLTTFNNTIPAALFYFFFLFPFYTFVLCLCWMKIGRSKNWFSKTRWNRWLVLAQLVLILILQLYSFIPFVCWIWTKRSAKWSQPIPFRPWIWSIILPLQFAVNVVLPGNCYNWLQGRICYSNLQILVEHLPRNGPVATPHWALGDGFFLGLSLFLAYAVALYFAVRNSDRPFKFRVGFRK